AVELGLVRDSSPEFLDAGAGEIIDAPGINVCGEKEPRVVRGPRAGTREDLRPNRRSKEKRPIVGGSPSGDRAAPCLAATRETEHTGVPDSARAAVEPFADRAKDSATGPARTRLKKKRSGSGPNLRLRMGIIAALSIHALLVTSVRLVSIQGMDSMKLAEKALSNRLVT